MGGHGGLNILPQKRWNVYRYDNRERVSRDEKEDELRRMRVQEHARCADLTNKIQYLRSKKTQGDRKSSNEKDFNNYIEHRRKELKELKERHVNIFEEEENMYNEAVARQQEYLRKVGQAPNDVSDFDRVLRVDTTPWYLRSRKDVFVCPEPPVIETPVVLERKRSKERSPSEKRHRKVKKSTKHRRHKHH